MIIVIILGVIGVVIFGLWLRWKAILQKNALEVKRKKLIRKAKHMISENRRRRV